MCDLKKVRAIKILWMLFILMNNEKKFRYDVFFSQLYVEEHDNVSILYADVVNYTKISTTLSPMRMVELLNELFGRFDEASEVSDSKITLDLQTTKTLTIK